VTFSPAERECPDTSGCPVLPESGLPPDISLVELLADTPLFRCYDGTWGFDEPNPGYGDARFSPFDDLQGGRVPTMYLAETPTAALLETVFDDVHQDADRLIYDRDLRATLLAHLWAPASLLLADLRDPALDQHGIRRDQIVSSAAEHYPCPRRLARQIHGGGFTNGTEVDGIIWHSRQAELHATGQSEVLVVFADRCAPGRGGWVRIGPGSQNLIEGPGRLLIDEIATELNATIVIEDGHDR
jgi:hypothetical protein